MFHIPCSLQLTVCLKKPKNKTWDKLPCWPVNRTILPSLSSTWSKPTAFVQLFFRCFVSTMGFPLASFTTIWENYVRLTFSVRIVVNQIQSMVKDGDVVGKYPPWNYKSNNSEKWMGLEYQAVSRLPGLLRHANPRSEFKCLAEAVMNRRWWIKWTCLCFWCLLGTTQRISKKAQFFFWELVDMFIIFMEI